MLAAEERDAAARAIVAQLGWTQPWFVVSALARDNTLAVCQAIQRFFDANREDSAGRDDMLPGDVRLRPSEPDA
jgi:GTP-binding protein